LIKLLKLTSLIIFINISFAYADKIEENAPDKVSISGYVRDAANGEALIGATIYIVDIKGGTTTNMYGFYSVTLDKGDYVIEYRYIGYHSLIKEISLNQNSEINIELSEDKKQLEEVVVIGKTNTNVKRIEMSVNKLDIKTIEKIPALLGEADVIKSLQLLPGVSTVGEGASGFNVRGGSVGQNLILQDEAPIYNSSHLFGFFSVFNPDAVRDVKLYKGGIPAHYGGRISSVLDIRLKEGNSKKFAAQGGVGTIFSRLTLEAPIVKDKSSFVIAARRSYIDVFAKLFTDVLSEGAQLYFYDLSLKGHYDIGKKDKIFLSGYLGRDVFKFDANQGFNWGNNTGTLRWNHIFNEKLFSNMNFIISDYDYALAFGENDLDKFEWDSKVRTLSFKPRLTYFANTNNIWDFGGEFNYYIFTPANATGTSNGEVANVSLPKKYAAEWSLYFNNELNFGNSFGLQYGLRGSGYSHIGPGTVYEYETIIPGQRKIPTSVEEIEGKAVIQNYFNLEPRISLKYQVTSNSSVKASYNRLSQNIHLISNTTASNPLDVWVPGSNNIKPELSNQYAFGFFKNFGLNNEYESSIEVYYRTTDSQIEYIDGADLLINQFLEGDLLFGIGRAYGLELFVKKNTGKLNGWISYTLGRSELKVDGINNSEWYPTRYDQLHNLKVAGFYEINERWTVSATFSFISGTPTTFPTSRFQNQEYLIPYNYLSSRNNTRIPNYHRLDVSVILNGKKYRKNGKERKNRDYWVFGVYNAYARKNPFSIYFSQGTDRPVSGEPVPTYATQLAIVGTIIPAISYNFNF
jgi:hypothetical protein